MCVSVRYDSFTANDKVTWYKTPPDGTGQFLSTTAVGNLWLNIFLLFQIWSLRPMYGLGLEESKLANVTADVRNERKSSRWMGLFYWNECKLYCRKLRKFRLNTYDEIDIIRINSRIGFASKNIENLSMGTGYIVLTLAGLLSRHLWKNYWNLKRAATWSLLNLQSTKVECPLFF